MEKMSNEFPGIDRVPTEMEWRRIRRQVEQLEEYHPERGAEFLPVTYNYDVEPTIGERLAKVWRTIKITARATPYFVQLIIGYKMKNWKTTLGAIIGGLATILNVLGIVDISAEVQMAIVTLGLFIVGLFAGDAQKTESSK
jgi:hypothetical protein